METGPTYGPTGQYVKSQVIRTSYKTGDEVILCQECSNPTWIPTAKVYYHYLREHGYSVFNGAHYNSFFTTIEKLYQHSNREIVILQLINFCGRDLALVGINSKVSKEEVLITVLSLEKNNKPCFEFAYKLVTQVVDGGERKVKGDVRTISEYHINAKNGNGIPVSCKNMFNEMQHKGEMRIDVHITNDRVKDRPKKPATSREDEEGLRRKQAVLLLLHKPRPEIKFD